MSDGRREDPGRRVRRAYREVLLGALDGVELNEAEVQLVDWLATWDEWTVTTTAMLIGAARAVGPEEVWHGW